MLLLLVPAEGVSQIPTFTSVLKGLTHEVCQCEFTAATKQQQSVQANEQIEKLLKIY